MNNSGFSGKSVFISGGTSGINLGIAKAFSAAGTKVAVLRRNKEKADNAALEIAALGGESMALIADVRDAAAVELAMKEAAGAFGPFDVVIAGVAGNFFAPAVGISPNGFKSVVDIDLLGTFHVFKAGYDLCAKPTASFIAITAPQAESPTLMQAHVCAAKAGVNALLKTLAMEWGPVGIRVNGICPGLTQVTEGLDRMEAADPVAAQGLTLPLQLERAGTIVWSVQVSG